MRQEIKDNDVITIEGQEYRINLTPIVKPVLKLIPNKQYILRYTGLFCHCHGINGKISSQDIKWDKRWEYIGVLEGYGNKHIFKGYQGYMMFGTNDLEFVVKECD